ncbi:zonular occludens toxin family protein [Delftia acidovorans]
MLTLITGNPGTGKTSALVSMLEELGKDRQLYVNGIPELLIPHVELTEPEKWHETVPDGSVIIIDEVQRIWRPSGPGQKIPEMIALLETHRHRGLDFYIITQGPNLIHANVRALIGRHVHLRDLGILGRWWYEWPECADNCRTGWKNAPIKKRYRLPKSVFGKYKSASIHVKPVRSFPWMLVVMIAALLTVFIMSWFAYRAINARLHPVAPEPVPTTPNSSLQPARQENQVNTVSSHVVAPDERVAFIPRLSDRPWTAPAYDEIRRVVAMPLITGAMCINDHCVCFNGSRRLLDVSSAACDEWRIQRPFNPYDSEPVLVDGGSVSDRTESSERQSVPGHSAS